MTDQKKLNLKPDFNVVFRGRIFEIVHFEGKPGVTFEAAVRAPGTRLLIETEKDGIKALLMNREIRREAKGYDFRLPGGKVFDSLAQLDAHRTSGDPIEPIAEHAARKEGHEEAGIDGGEYELIQISTAGATVDWDLYYYRVTGAEMGQQNLDDLEQGDIDVVILSAHEIFEKLSAGEIMEGRSAAVLWKWLQSNEFITFTQNPTHA